MDYDGDIVMGDFPGDLPIHPEVPTQSSLADFTLTFGKFKGKRLCEVPRWYLQWLPNISDPSPTFTAALAYALGASSFTEMEIDWNAPSISAAPDKFHQWRKLNEGERKSRDTALWISTTDTMKYFSLTDEILRVMNVRRVEELSNDEPSQTNAKYDKPFQKNVANVQRYALYHIYDLAQVYMTRGEVDFALRKYMNERLRGIGQDSPRKTAGSRFY
ncbi:hypothetical protein EG329_011015 [Mollisiaceae sp. DMI_Dod_QoI]|nr:hypothetical protein EG329_011015 [Helotiales sp. DMI_Dod_QoI]